MTFDWLQFVAFGEPPVIPVATLPSDLCRIIGSDTPLVRLRHDYALKFHRKHGFSIDEFPLLPIAIDLGRVISDKSFCLTFFYFERVISNHWYEATLKCVSNRTEIWVTTFHPTNYVEVKRMCKRCPVLRADETMEVEQIKTDGN
jgi:hypothetical protein